MADADTSSLFGVFRAGVRVKVGHAAGRRLASKHGTVIGSGKYPDAVRLILDGAKTPITLHKKYLSYEGAS